MAPEMDDALAPVELSEQELDNISGGFDIAFSASMFEQIDEMSAQTVGNARTGGMSSAMSRSSRIFASSMQFVGTGFQSASEALEVFAGLARLFGR